MKKELLLFRLFVVVCEVRLSGEVPQNIKLGWGSPRSYRIELNRLKSLEGFNNDK